MSTASLSLDTFTEDSYIYWNILSYIGPCKNFALTNKRLHAMHQKILLEVSQLFVHFDRDLWNPEGLPPPYKKVTVEHIPIIQKVVDREFKKYNNLFKSEESFKIEGFSSQRVFLNPTLFSEMLQFIDKRALVKILRADPSQKNMFDLSQQDPIATAAKNVRVLKLAAKEEENPFLGTQPTVIIYRLPQCFGGLYALTTLELQNNKLQVLPESFGNLISLAILHLHNNELKSLPKSMGSLQALSVLFLHNNKLQTLPESFGNLNALTFLDIHGNPMAARERYLNSGLQELSKKGCAIVM